MAVDFDTVRVIERARASRHRAKIIGDVDLNKDNNSDPFPDDDAFALPVGDPLGMALPCPAVLEEKAEVVLGQLRLGGMRALRPGTRDVPRLTLAMRLAVMTLDELAAKRRRNLREQEEKAAAEAARTKVSFKGVAKLVMMMTFLGARSKERVDERRRAEDEAKANAAAAAAAEAAEAAAAVAREAAVRAALPSQVSGVAFNKLHRDDPRRRAAVANARAAAATTHLPTKHNINNDTDNSGNDAEEGASAAAAANDKAFGGVDTTTSSDDNRDELHQNPSCVAALPKPKHVPPPAKVAPAEPPCVFRFVHRGGGCTR
jgi:hypothetical protein